MANMNNANNINNNYMNNMNDINNMNNGNNVNLNSMNNMNNNNQNMILINNNNNMIRSMFDLMPNNMNYNLNNNNMNNDRTMPVNNNFNYCQNFHINNNLNNNNNFQSNSIFQNKENTKKEDPYQIQRRFALKANNNQNYEHYNNNGHIVPNFFYQSSDDNPFRINSNDIVNIVFKVQKGNAHSRAFDKNIKVESMLSKFLESVGLNDFHKNNIYFLFNSSRLNDKDNIEKTLAEIGLRNCSRITVIDMKDIIGA